MLSVKWVKIGPGNFVGTGQMVSLGGQTGGFRTCGHNRSHKRPSPGLLGCADCLEIDCALILKADEGRR